MARILHLHRDAPVRGDDVNRQLALLQRQLDELQSAFDGLRSGRLAFAGNLNLNGFRVTNAGASRTDNDALTLGELLGRLDDLEAEATVLETNAAEDYGGGARQRRLQQRTSRLTDLANDAAAGAIETAIPTVAPPIVAAASSLGTVADPVLFALSDHTHGFVDHIDVYHDVLSGDEPTTVFSLSDTPIAGTDIVSLNGVRLRRVSAPALRTYHEELAGSGTSFVLANTPAPQTEVLTFNALRLRRVAAAPGLNEYSISGATVTLGFTKDAADSLVADYSINVGPGINEYSISGSIVVLGFPKLAGDFLVADYRVAPQTRRTFGEILTGAGTAFTLSRTPVTGSEVLTYNTLRLRRVASSPSVNEYTISGASVTLGFTKGAGDSLLADYDVTQVPAEHVHVYSEELTGTGTSFSLASTPAAGSEVLWFNTVRQRRVAASPSVNEYTISGAAITLGMSKEASDALVADYVV